MGVGPSEGRCGFDPPVLVGEYVTGVLIRYMGVEERDGVSIQKGWDPLG